MTMPPPNWYADPAQPGVQRFWTGDAWTETTRPSAATPSPPPPPAQPPAQTQAQAQATFQPQAQAAFQPQAQAQATFQPQAPATFQPQAEPAAAGWPDGASLSPGDGASPALMPSISRDVSANALQPRTPGTGSSSLPGAVKPRRRFAPIVPSLFAIVLLGTLLRLGIPALIDVFNAPHRSTSAADVVVPAGWELFTSRSGAVAYARDPLWRDVYTVQDENSLDRSALSSDESAEIAGSWLLLGVSSSTELGIVVRTDPGRKEDLDSWALALEQVGSPTSSASFTGSDRYDGWRVDYTKTSSGRTVYGTSIVLLDHDTTVLLIALSVQPRTNWIDDIVDVASSVVVIGPAGNP